MEYRIHTQEPHPDELWSPRANLECGRISVILGSNGAGKTQLIHQIIHKRVTTPGKGQSYLFIESNRKVAEDLISVKIQPGNLETPEKAEAFYTQQRGANLTLRIKHSLVTLCQRKNSQKQTYYDQIAAWDRKGRQGDAPRCSETDFDKAIRLFKEIFSEIAVKITTADQIYLAQRGKEYPISAASEGERQVFALICDIILNTHEDDFIIIVDEPESHLNSILANQLWDMIERIAPKAQFIYCSHSVSFAMRKNVESLYFLGKESNGLKALRNISDLPSDDMSALLGAIPAIVSSKRSLCVEGTDTSFDLPFYNWLLKGSQIKIIPLGSNTDVIANTKRLDLWSNLASGCEIVGIVDRDYRLQTSNSSGSSILYSTLHEAESYLCLPSLIVAVSKTIEAEELSSSDRVSQAILLICHELKSHVISQWLAHEINPARGMSLEWRKISEDVTLGISVADALLLQLQKKKEELEIASDPENIKRIIDIKTRELDSLFQSKDINGLLRVFPGKEILSRLVSGLGGIGVADLLELVITNFEPDTFPELVELRENIKEKFTVA